MGFELPRLTPLQAVLLLDGLEALAQQIAQQYGEEIERFYFAETDPDVDVDARDAPATGDTPPTPHEGDLPF